MAQAHPQLTYVTASDEAVVEGLLVSVASFLHQHREAAELRVCVIDGGIEEATWSTFQKDLEAWAQGAGIEFQLDKWQGDLKRWEQFPPHWGSWAVYSSLDIFLADFDGWVVFGDVDLFHGRSIWDQLPKVAEHGSAVGAIVDPFKTTSDADRYVQLVRPEISQPVDYVNTGFLVVDRSRFDREGFRSFLDKLEPGILSRDKGKRSLFDQSLLNGYFAGQLALLDESCNRVVRDGRDFRFGSSPANLHFVGQPKPWKDEEKVSPERFVAWAAAANALGLSQSGCDLAGFELNGGGLAEGFRKLRYRLLGKQAKLEKIEARFSEAELRALYEKTCAWFS